MLSMGLLLILGIIVLVVDFVFSMWNSYNAGRISAVRPVTGKLFYALGGFLPMGYVLAIVITFIVSYLGYISYSSAVFLLSFSFLFFGLAFIVWGVMATYVTARTAVRGGGWLAWLVTIYDAFATIWDAWDYISGFFSNVRSLRRAIDSSDFSLIDVVLVLATAFAAAFLVTYAAYREGRKAGRLLY
jgi:hypothetical protein